MQNKQFLTPAVRIVICLLGMLIMGYFIVEDFRSGAPADTVLYVRIGVFCAFGYFLIRTFTSDQSGSGGPTGIGNEKE
jgi:uncharacterized protein YneF (UPF0154 family)